jgi:hypothetical protein
VITEDRINEARIARATAPSYAAGSRSQLGPTRNQRRGRKLGLEHAMREARKRPDYHRFLADILNTGKYGSAVDDPAFARMVLAGAAEGYAGGGFPMAAGGVDVSAALTSVRPGIRKIKRKITSVQLSAGQREIIIELPKSGYLEKPTIRIEGTIKVVQGATAQAITVSDIRNLVQRVRFELSSTVVPKSLSGLQCDIIDNLDVAVVNANKNTVPTSAELSGAKETTVEKKFILELSPRFTVSDQNLYGIPYLGAISTVPRLVIELAPLIGTAGESPLTQAGAGPTATLENCKVVVDGWRVDLPAPVAPSATTDAEGNTIQIPGEGLWAESGYLLKTRPIDSQDQVSAGLERQFHIPIGPMYTRLILLAYVGHILDTEVESGKTGILARSELGVQEATIIEQREPWQFDSDYRDAYFKTRPAGVYVHSGIDQSGTDEDLWVTQDLGNFTLTAFTTSRADGEAGTKYECLAQSLAPISRPGLYA